MSQSNIIWVSRAKLNLRQVVVVILYQLTEKFTLKIYEGKIATVHQDIVKTYIDEFFTFDIGKLISLCLVDFEELIPRLVVMASTYSKDT